MPITVPAIYAPAGVAAQLTFVQRTISAATALATLALLVIAYSLTPSVTGVETHLGLGLPRCAFMYYSGLPCPTCGMTTSYSFFAHGNLSASLWVQPMAALLATLTAMTFWASAYAACTGRDVTRLLRRWPMHRLALTLVALGIAAWGWKIFIHLRGIDGWR